MRVKSLYISNFRSFSSAALPNLGQVNVFIGENNSGKSSILKALHLMQQGVSEIVPNVRIGSRLSSISVELEDVPELKQWRTYRKWQAALRIEIKTADRVSGDLRLQYDESGMQTVEQLPNKEPDHFIVPYLSKRKTTHYQEDVRMDNALLIGNDMSLLAAKLSRAANPSFPGFEIYRNACEEILGFVVSAVSSANGQRPGRYLPSGEILPIDLMGDGVPNIVSLLADLAFSKGKLFLIEEPENDLHPNALKALLDLILQSSKENQFVVSTHSNIVVRHLAVGESSRLYSINLDRSEMPPAATVSEVERTPQARLAVLRELGYAFSDFDLWDGWLILEESSAERIIRDYLIPWFVPKLARIRTIATGGNGQVEATFKDFNRMVRFTHLEEAYRNAAWVRIDGDSASKAIVEKLRTTYSSWNQDRFQCYGKTQFEEYYPATFKEKIALALSEANKQARQDAKRLLLNEVRAWLDKDETRGRAALGESAAEVIADLQSIADQVR